MRIVAGHLRGRVLNAPDTKGTRPTSDKTRETLFNILQHADWSPPLEDARILDLYAGSGALGFEALSRGAASAMMVDMAHAARQAIKQTTQQFDLDDQVIVLKRDVTRLGSRPDDIDAFDVVLCDPPYRKGLAQKALHMLATGNWLAPDGVVVVETAADETLEDAGWERFATRKIGPAMLWFFGRA